MARRSFVSVLVVGSLLAAAGPGLAYPRPGRTVRVSVAADGASPSSFSNAPTVSGDGRYVSFYSDSSDLVPDDTNGFGDVFVRDMVEGTTELISAASDGGPSNGGGAISEISDDGRYVAFWSGSTNLVPGDGNARYDIFVRDRLTGVTERVSVSSAGQEGNQHSNPEISMSADGRYAAFESLASNLVPGDTNGRPDVFVRDRVDGVTTLVSRATGGALPNNASGGASLSADGRYVSFLSAATNLASDDTAELQTPEYDVFVRDLVTGVTERVSEASDGSRANVGAVNATISGDGRYVAFQTQASNLVPRDTNAVNDVFVHDRVTGLTERVSVSSDGAGGDGSSREPFISGDGRHVAFLSYATNLVPGDTNAEPDVFVHDRLTGITQRVSVAGDGTQGDFYSWWQNISADGRHVVFTTSATNLVPDDTNEQSDVVIRDTGPPVGIGALEVAGTEEPSVSGWANFAGQVVSSADDAQGDAGPGAAEVGGDLTGATVVHRPEREDLLVRMNVTRLPGLRTPYLGLGAERGEEVPGVAGIPTILHGLELRAGGIRYEVRALRAGATAVPPAEPYFALYRCVPSCAEVARLTGGYGDAGDRIEVSVPLSALSAGDETPLTGIRAFSAVGEAAPGSIHLLDEVSLPDATLRFPGVTLGIAPAGSPEHEVVFDTPAELSDGVFSGTVNAAFLQPGEHELWARACLGETCGAASIEVAS